MVEQIASLVGIATLGNVNPEPGESLVTGCINHDTATLTLLYQRTERERVGRRTVLRTFNRAITAYRRATPDGQDYHWVASGRPVVWQS